MSAAGIPKTFWSSPVRYLRWASHEKPAIFYSIIIGGLGPVMLLVVPPMRRWAGDQSPPKIPLTYPSEWKWSLLFLSVFPLSRCTLSFLFPFALFPRCESGGGLGGGAEEGKRN